MSKSTNKAVNEAHKRIYDETKIITRKDSTYNKNYLLKHISEYGYKSMNEFIITAIYNQIENDLSKNNK